MFHPIDSWRFSMKVAIIVGVGDTLGPRDYSQLIVLLRTFMCPGTSIKLLEHEAEFLNITHTSLRKNLKKKKIPVHWIRSCSNYIKKQDVWEMFGNNVTVICVPADCEIIISSPLERTGFSLRSFRPKNGAKYILTEYSEDVLEFD
jgi:hypothetical protein